MLITAKVKTGLVSPKKEIFDTRFYLFDAHTSITWHNSSFI